MQERKEQKKRHRCPPSPPLTPHASPTLTARRFSISWPQLFGPSASATSRADAPRGNGGADSALGGGGHEGAHGGALGRPVAEVAGDVVPRGDGGGGEGGWVWVRALGGAGVLRLPQVHLRRRHAPGPPRRRRRHPSRPRPAHSPGQSGERTPHPPWFRFFAFQPLASSVILPLGLNSAIWGLGV
jgi:hypothetical protein